MRGADFPDIKEGRIGKMPIRYILEKNFQEKALCDGNIVVEISGGSPTQSTGRVVLADKGFIADCDNALICTNFCKSLEIKDEYSFFFYPIPIHSKHNLIALLSTVSASPRIAP